MLKRDYRDVLVPAAVIALIAYAVTNLWFPAWAAFVGAVVLNVVYHGIARGPRAWAWLVSLFQRPEPHVWEPLEERRSVRITRPRQ